MEICRFIQSNTSDPKTNENICGPSLSWMHGEGLDFVIPDAEKGYSRELIDIVGMDGGFIMGSRSIMDNVDPHLVKVWEEYTKEYGMYK